MNGIEPGQEVHPLTKLPEIGGNYEKFAESLMREPDGDIMNGSSYLDYKERIAKIFGYENYKTCRDIDRALWVYGHLFPGKIGSKGC